MIKQSLPTLTQLNTTTSGPQMVQVYLRNSKKEAKLIPFRTPAAPSELIVIASIRFNIPQKRIILFYNGFRIDNYSLPINLVDKGIIHILDTRNIEQQSITVYLKPIGWSSGVKQELASNSTVQQVAQSYIVPYLGVEPDRFFIVYIGKILNPSNTLKEQFIENGAELMVVEYKGPPKQAYELHTSQHIRPLLQSTVRINMPVTYKIDMKSIKDKNQLQASLNQQYFNISAAALEDSFFNPNLEKTEGAYAPGEKKQSKLQLSDKERSSGSSGEKKPKGAADCAPEDKIKGTLLLQTNLNLHAVKNGLENTANPLYEQEGQSEQQKKKNGQKSSL